MAALSDLLPSFLKSAARDQVMTMEFTSLKGVLVLLLGYERGFQVWDLSETNRPALILSKRTVALSVVTSVREDELGTLLLVHKYDSAEFPRDIIRTFALASRTYETAIRAMGKVRSVLTSCKVICIITDSGLLEVLAASTKERLYSLQLARPETPAIIQPALSTLYLAYSLQRIPEPEDIPPDESLTGLVTRSIYSLADQSYSTVKAYLETGSPTIEGKLQILHVTSKAAICEIQAFPGPVAMMKFSPPGHLLVVAPQSGQFFHVYRINPPLSHQKSGNLVRYLLVYKLYRGFTQATISDISISGSEQWICVASSRGTAHIYQVDPAASTLHYNHQVYSRIKQGWFTGESAPAPRCFLSLANRQSTRDRVRFEEPLLVLQTPLLVAVTVGGRYSTHEVGSESMEKMSVDIGRDVGFDEVDRLGEFRPVSHEERRWDEPLFHPDPGWLPLVRSPQIRMLTTTSLLSDFVLGQAVLQEAASPIPLSSHVIHYSSPTSRNGHILDSLQTSLSMQTVPLHVNTEFIETEQTAIEDKLSI